MDTGLGFPNLQKKLGMVIKKIKNHQLNLMAIDGFFYLFNLYKTAYGLGVIEKGVFEYYI